MFMLTCWSVCFWTDQLSQWCKTSQDCDCIKTTLHTDQGIYYAKLWFNFEKTTRPNRTTDTYIYIFKFACL